MARARRSTRQKPSELHEAEGPHLFREVIRVHQLLVGGFTRAVGMPAAKVGVLRQLICDGDRELGVGELAQALGVTPAVVTRQVQDLEREGFVARRGDPRDGRRSYLRLTDAGKRTIEQLHSRAHRMEALLLGDLPESDVKTASRVLSTIRQRLEKRRAMYREEAPEP